MKTLDIVHPAAKTLVDISLAQDAEVCPRVAWVLGRLMHTRLLCYRPAAGRVQCLPALAALVQGPHRKRATELTTAACTPAGLQVGDGTTTVVLLAAQFLKECKAFVEEGVHPQVGSACSLPACLGVG